MCCKNYDFETEAMNWFQQQQAIGREQDTQRMKTKALKKKLKKEKRARKKAKKNGLLNKQSDNYINVDSIFAGIKPIKVKSEGGINASIMAKRLIKDNCFVMLGNALYIYSEPIYLLLNDNDLNKIINKAFEEQIQTHGKPDVIKDVRRFIQLDVEIYRQISRVDTSYIILRNKRIDIMDGSVEDNSCDIFQTTYVNIDYDPDDHKCPNFKAFLKSVSGGSKPLKRLILEVLGYLLTPDITAKKFFVCIGPGDTGKSLFINLVCSFFEENMTSSVELQSLGDRFSGANLVGSRVNTGGDLPNKPLSVDVVRNVKCLTGGDVVSVERKYVQPFKYYPTCKLLFATNHELVLTTPDLQFEERRITIPFLNKVPKESQDHELLEKLKQERSAIFNKALKAYQTLRANNYQFTECEYDYKETQLYQEECISFDNDTVSSQQVIEFVENCCTITDNDSDFVTSEDLYNAYKRYRKTNSKTAMTNDTFIKTLVLCYASDAQIVRKKRGKRGFSRILFKNAD